MTTVGEQAAPAAPSAPERRRFRWRRVLLGVAAFVVFAAAVVGVLAVRAYQDALRSNVGELSFRNRLQIPRRRSRLRSTTCSESSRPSARLPQPTYRANDTGPTSGTAAWHACPSASKVTTRACWCFD
jgi:hypothetical protein